MCCTRSDYPSISFCIMFRTISRKLSDFFAVMTFSTNSFSPNPLYYGVFLSHFIAMEFILSFRITTTFNVVSYMNLVIWLNR